MISRGEHAKSSIMEELAAMVIDSFQGNSALGNVENIEVLMFVLNPRIQEIVTSMFFYTDTILNVKFVASSIMVAAVATEIASKRNRNVIQFV